MNPKRALVALALGAAVALGVTSAAAIANDAVRFSDWGAEALSFLRGAPYYLSEAELARVTLAPPPLNRSDETRAELTELVRLESIRTLTERAAIVQHLDYRPLMQLFVRAAGRDLATLPRTRALLDHVNLDGRWLVFHAKQRFARPRPTQLEPRLAPCIPVPAHPAYPSSHATQGYLLGRLLGELAPESRDRLAALGVQIGHEREIAGVHYPSDSVAGRELGESLFTLLRTNDRFTRELGDARAEWPR